MTYKHIAFVKRGRTAPRKQRRNSVDTQKQACTGLQSFCEQHDEGDWIGMQSLGGLRICRNVHRGKNPMVSHHRWIQNRLLISRSSLGGQIIQMCLRSELISILLWISSKVPLEHHIQDQITTILAETIPVRSGMIQIIYEGLNFIGNIYNP